MLPLAAGAASMSNTLAADRASLAQRTAAPHDLDALAFELYTADVAYGIVKPTDQAAPGEGPSGIALQPFLRRARAIIYNLGRVPDDQIVEACRAESAETPRGGAAAIELRHRRLG